MNTVAIIDYGSGNLHSAAKMFELVGRDTGHEIVVTDNIFEVKQASHIVLPGVGAVGDCMAGLMSVPYMIETLEEEVHERGKPFLGICVGMQLLAQRGYEHGEHQGLGWLNAEVVAIEAEDERIPHMGWNELELVASHPIISGIEPTDHAYFVHSYVMDCGDVADRVAEVSYAGKLTAVVARENIMGTQFHPEKSQKTGLKVNSNFLSMEAM